MTYDFHFLGTGYMGNERVRILDAHGANLLNDYIPRFGRDNIPRSVYR